MSDDPLRCPSVTVRTRPAPPRRARHGIAQQVAAPADDTLTTGADQPYEAGLDAFRTLRRLAHHEHGHVQARRFFLNAARVGEHEGGVLHQVHEREVVERLDQRHVGLCGEDRLYGLSYVRIQMDRINELHVWKLDGQIPDRQAQLAKRVAEAFASVRGDQHDWMLARDAGQGASLPVVGTVDDVVQRVDHRVARDVDVLLGAPLVEQRAGGNGGRREVRVSEDIGNAPIHLLWKRTVFVASAKARLDVTEPDTMVVRFHRGNEHRGRVALRQDPVGAHVGDHRIQGHEQIGGELRERLVLRHHVQVDIRHDLEQVQDLIQHLAVLARRADDRTDLVRMPPQFGNHRGHLDGLWPRAENAEYCEHREEGAAAAAYEVIPGRPGIAHVVARLAATMA